MKSAVLDESDLNTFEMLWGLQSFRSTCVQNLVRSSVGIAAAIAMPHADPGRPPAVWRRLPPKMPAWATPLVKHRNMFMGAALAIRRTTGAVEYWKMVFAVQSPEYYLGLCKLNLVALPSMHDLQALHPREPFVFHMNFAECCSAADVNIAGLDEVRILFRLCHVGGTRLTSDMQPISLDLILAGDDQDIGPDEQKDSEEASRKQDPVYEQLVQVMPWLRHLDLTQGLSGAASGEAIEGSGGARGAATSGLRDIDEDELLVGLRALERERMDAAMESAFDTSRDFVPKVRGGKSQILKSGEAVHAIQGQCANQDADFWARTYAQVSFKATFSEHTAAASKLLVRSWCHRMQFFFSLMQSAPEGSEFRYTPEIIASYKEPTELTALAGDVRHPKWKGWMGRIGVIRSIPRP